jgi:tRNA 5-methylaminomethyl-2-thiouridine biosynthesis bifunctional protein
VPSGDGSFWMCGASFHRDDSDTQLRQDDQQSNFERLETLLPAVAGCLAPAFEKRQVQAWAAIRCASPDRLPLVGPVHQATRPGLWVHTAMGSRGLTFAVICAELLAALLHAEPLPMEHRLAKALAAQRFGPAAGS